MSSGVFSLARRLIFFLNLSSGQGGFVRSAELLFFSQQREFGFFSDVSRKKMFALKKSITKEVVRITTE